MVFDEKKKRLIEYHKNNSLCRWNTSSLTTRLMHPRTSLYGLFTSLRYNYGIEELLKRHNELIMGFAREDSKMMSNLSFPAYIDRDYCPKSVFDSVVEVTFEAHPFWAMNGYDSWLRIIYGDYMKLPPKEKQVPGHDMHHYYWK